MKKPISNNDKKRIFIHLLKAIQKAKLVYMALLIAIFSACSWLGANQSPEQPIPMRVTVGKVKVVRIPSTQDSTLQIAALSENMEVVDVTKREDSPANANRRKANQEVFLIKGVTAGTVKVVFSEKRIGEEGQGRILKSYLVKSVVKD